MFVSSTQVSKEGKVGKAQYNDVSYLLKLVSTKVGIILPEGRLQQVKLKRRAESC